jgi:hypothetical protein
MLRLVAMAAALVLSWATLELRPVSAATTAKVNVEGGVPRTAKALRAAAGKHELDGHVWLGKLRSVGGGRDTLIYVPRDLRTTQPIELVVYMEGHGSFADDAMDHRHAASIARLRGNRVYVAPDAPSSAHGQRKARTPYWRAGCGERRCAGGHSAPGDFIAFLAEARAHVAAVTGAADQELSIDVSLIGFSNGGKGVVNALTQLAAAGFAVGEHQVRLVDVIFADGNYGATALADAWKVLASRQEAPRLTILVGDGRFDARDPAGGNRSRAAAFWQRVAPRAAPPARGRAAQSGRIRVIPLRDSHHAIGDAAVDYLAPASGDVAADVP